MEILLEKPKESLKDRVFEIPLIAKGKLITDYSVTYKGRHGAEFITSDPKRFLQKIVMKNPSELNVLYSLSLDEILEYLDDLGKRLVIEENEYLQDAFELGCYASGLTPSVLYTTYKSLPLFFEKSAIWEMLEQRIGVKYLENWEPARLNDGRTIYLRAFGSRSVHIIAGNVPIVAAGTIIRGCSTRCNTIIKLPSNDPLTATALARTMIDMDPTHPITKNISVLYYKGGDIEFEESFYRPEYIEKIIAWGGYSSVQYITRYMQPGIDLITLDPKLSTSIIGVEAFSSEKVMRTVAQRAAIDIGSYNGEACLNSKVIYVQSGTDPDGIQKLNQLGAYIYYSLTALPPHISTAPKKFDLELKSAIDGLRTDDEWYKVYGGENNEGAVIVSQLNEPVDFSYKLCNRVVNLVPIDTMEEAIRSVNSYTQTVGIYPESLKKNIRDDLILHGVQRIVSLGFAPRGSLATPQDAIEPLRRMCKWVIDESSV